MGTVGAYEAKTHLPKLLDRVARGERIVITRHGTPVAVLSPPEPTERADVGEIIEELRRFRQGHHASPDDIREWVEEGRDGRRLGSWSTTRSS